MSNEDLLNLAREARQHAYVPYSEFRVGAALLTESGKVFTGANVENASYGLTVCAERIAVFKAVTEGFTDFAAIAVVGSGEGYAYPCGACRQVLAEFSSDMLVIVGDENLNSREYYLHELLPCNFQLPEQK